MNFAVKKFGLLFIIGALFFSSCKDSTEILLDPGDEANKIGTAFDTVTVHSSTVLLEEFSTCSETVGQDFIVFGKYNDSDLGTVEAKSFAEVAVPTKAIPTNATLVSFKLHLDIDYVAGEKTIQDIQVYKLKDTLDFNKMRNREYLFDSQVEYHPQLLNISSTIDPNAKAGQVSVELDQTLAEEFFTAMVNKSEAFKSQKDFKVYFPGLAILGDVNNTAVLGSSRDSSKIVLKYRVDTVLTDVEFKLSSPYHFSNVATSNKSALSANVDKTFIQSSTGILTKISFPTVTKLKEYGKRVALNKVELIIAPEEDEVVAPPSNLFLIHAFGDSIHSAVQSTLYPEVHLGNSNALNLAYNDNRGAYVADITSYVEAILQEVKNGDGNPFPTDLYLYPDASGAIIDRRYIWRGNSTSGYSFAKDLTVSKAAIKKENIKIKVYYTIVADF